MKSLRVSAGLDPRHGGPAHSTLLSALATSSSGGIEVAVITVEEGMASASAIERLRDAGVAVRLFPLSALPAARRFTISWSLIRWLWGNAQRFDVIHVHGAWTASSLAGLLAGRARRVPVVLTPHESMTHHDIETSGLAMRIVKLLFRQIYFRLLSAVIYASDIERRDSQPRGRAYHAVLPHPVEQVGTERSKGNTSGVTRIGFLGRFDPKKNLDVLLRALPEDAELVVAGDGTVEARRTLAEVARASGIDGRVRWLGFVEGREKEQFLDQIEVLAMPSRYECFGMVAAEALAAGVPVVVSPRTGIAALVRKHDCGFVVEPEEESLRAALSKRGELNAMAARARKAARAELSPEGHAERVIALYRLVGGEKR